MSNLISKVAGSVKNWWVFLITGILFILAAFWLFRTPVESFVGLAGLFSAMIFVSGIFSVIFAISNRSDMDNFGLYIAYGVLDIVVGFILLKYPGITVLLFSLFVGFWLLFRGFNLISASLKVKEAGDSNWFWILLLGILTVILALMSIVNPLIGASYLVYTLALALLFLGIAQILLSMQLKKVKSGVGKIKEKIADL